MGIKHKLKDLTGLQFGRLTPQWPSGRLRKRTIWLCLCTCGIVRPRVGEDALVSGNSKSCGCLQREHAARTGSAKKLPHHAAGYNAMFSRYKIWAIRRKLRFDLSKEQFLSFVKNNCHYCGRAPRRGYVNSSVFCICNGIDRKDNVLGYELSNIVTCCKDCNFMKMKLGYAEFIENCRMIVRHLGNR